MQKKILLVALLVGFFVPVAANAQVLNPPINRPPTSRPPAATPPTRPAPTQNVRPTQLSGCQNWVLRLQDVSRSSVIVAPGTARSVPGAAQVLWQIRNGVDRGFCLVRRDGRVMSAVQYTSSGTLHYFPTEEDEVGGPVQRP